MSRSCWTIRPGSDRNVHCAPTDAAELLERVMFVGRDRDHLRVGHRELRIGGGELEVLLVLLRAVVAASEREDHRVVPCSSLSLRGVRCGRAARSRGRCRRGRCLTSWRCPFMLDASADSRRALPPLRETIRLSRPASRGNPRRGIPLALDGLPLATSSSYSRPKSARESRRPWAAGEQVPDRCDSKYRTAPTTTTMRTTRQPPALAILTRSASGSDSQIRVMCP